MLRVIGLDVALDKTGICLAGGSTLTSKGGKGDARLLRLYWDVLDVADNSDHGLLAILEDLPANAMSAGLTGKAQGVVRLALQRKRVSYVTVAAATLKKWATGNGRASKDDMIKAAQDSGWKTIGRPSHDEADAYLLRELGLARLRGEAQAVKVDWSPWEGWL